MVKFSRHYTRTKHTSSPLLGGMDLVVFLLGHLRQKNVWFGRGAGMGGMLSTITLGDDRKTVYLSCVCGVFYRSMLQFILPTSFQNLILFIFLGQSGLVFSAIALYRAWGCSEGGTFIPPAFKAPATISLQNQDDEDNLLPETGCMKNPNLLNGSPTCSWQNFIAF